MAILFLFILYLLLSYWRKVVYVHALCWLRQSSCGMHPEVSMAQQGVLARPGSCRLAMVEMDIYRPRAHRVVLYTTAHMTGGLCNAYTIDVVAQQPSKCTGIMGPQQAHQPNQASQTARWEFTISKAKGASASQRASPTEHEKLCAPFAQTASSTANTPTWSHSQHTGS